MHCATETAPRARSDFREGDAKQASRLFNLQALTDSLCIADPGERLWLDWLELAGESPPTVDLLAPMLGPGRFIGVDSDRGVITRNAARGQPHTVWHHGRLQSLLVDRPDLFARVGVLNYDSFAGWHADAIIAETAPLVAFARYQQREKTGEFVLIVNAAMTRNVPRAAAMSRVQRVFRPLLAPHGRQVEDSDVFVYRAAGGKNDMLNVRVKVGFD